MFSAIYDCSVTKEYRNYVNHINKYAYGFRTIKRTILVIGWEVRNPQFSFVMGVWGVGGWGGGGGGGWGGWGGGVGGGGGGGVGGGGWGVGGGSIFSHQCRYIEGILPKGSYLPYVSMAGRAVLAGYHRYGRLSTLPINYSIHFPDLETDWLKCDAH